MRIAIIGFGRFGRVLFQKFNKNHQVRYICDNSDMRYASYPICKNYKRILRKVDLAVVATPSKTHYTIVKDCLLSGKDVFVEKPLCLKYEQAKELIDIAKNKKLKLYVDDVFLHRTEYKKIKELNNITEIKFTWKKYGTFDDSIINALFYHDLLMLMDLFDGEVSHIAYKKGKEKLRINFNIGNVNVECNYDRKSSKKEKKVEVFGYRKGRSFVKKIIFEKEDVLDALVPKIMDEKVDYKKNNTISLRAVKELEKVKNSMFKVAVVGGGIFGCTTAWTLAKKGYQVDLFEAKKDIFMCASGINQNRLHKGFHYPRSGETILTCLEGEKQFRKVYGKAVIDNKHYYGIAKEDSLMNAKQCFDVWDKYGLEYKEVDIGFINKDSFEKIIQVKEGIIDPFKLKKICKSRLNQYNVNLILNKKASMRGLKKYDMVIIATYAFNNTLLKGLPKREFQFELIEKLVLKLPKKYKDISFVVQDGPFTCIDPLGKTGWTLMGNVVHAIHSQNIGKFPEIPKEYKKLINNGIIKNPLLTKVDDFLDVAEKFFPGIKKDAKHIGSMYTIRTVLPRHEHDDARPTIIDQIGKRIITVFSGKIPTCIDSANKIMELIDDESSVRL